MLKKVKVTWMLHDFKVITRSNEKLKFMAIFVTFVLHGSHPFDWKAFLLRNIFNISVPVSLRVIAFLGLVLTFVFVFQAVAYKQFLKIFILYSVLCLSYLLFPLRIGICISAGCLSCSLPLEMSRCSHHFLSLTSVFALSEDQDN